MTKRIIGTAAWSIGREMAGSFAAEGSGLQRYASVFSGVEVDSTFYRSHRETTYKRWAASVPADFRFAVKCPRTVTHELKLVGVAEILSRFIGEVGALGDRLGPLLVQLPPHLKYDPEIAAGFFDLCRASYSGPWLFEPRHVSWFEPEAKALLVEKGISRVAADPAILPEAAEPGGAGDIAYWRLHGSPEVYYSSYSQTWLENLKARLDHSTAKQTWCIFDNTASGAALKNALSLHQMHDVGRTSTVTTDAALDKHPKY